MMDVQVSLAGPRVAHQTKLVIKNDLKTDVDEITVCVPTMVRSHAAKLEVGHAVGDSPAVLEQLSEWAAPPGAPAGAECGTFKLRFPLHPGDTGDFLVMAVLIRVLRPYPAAAKQGDPQRMLYEGDFTHVISPYPILEETAVVQLGPGALESHTAEAPAKLKQGIWSLGPYRKIAPWGAEPLRVHYQNTEPFLEATSVEREVDVSHWGVIYFEERYAVVHTGTKTAGEWSRFETMTKESASRAAVRALPARLPKDAQWIFFRDEIGNISSSMVARNSKETSVLLTPRYPLFGGWLTTFKFGWAVPLASVARTLPDGQLGVVFDLTPAIPDLVVGDLSVRVVLPEGATLTHFECALAHELVESKTYSYLDVFGRPQLDIRVKDFVPETGVPIVIFYEVNRLATLQKPTILALLAVLVIALAGLVQQLSSGSGAAVAAATSAVVKPHAS